MYVVMGVHHPKAGMEKPLLEVQERFGAAQRRDQGLISAVIWKDEWMPMDCDERRAG